MDAEPAEYQPQPWSADSHDHHDDRVEEAEELEETEETPASPDPLAKSFSKQTRRSSAFTYEPLKRAKTSVGGFGERNGNAVDIEEAISNYEEMRRELTRQSAVAPDTDTAEKGAQERFDLTDFLSGIDRQKAEQGFQRKELGLVVKNLTVMVRNEKRQLLSSQLYDTLSFLHMFFWQC